MSMTRVRFFESHVDKVTLARVQRLTRYHNIIRIIICVYNNSYTHTHTLTHTLHIMYSHTEELGGIYIIHVLHARNLHTHRHRKCSRTTPCYIIIFMYSYIIPIISNIFFLSFFFKKFNRYVRIIGTPRHKYARFNRHLQ